MDSKLAVIIPAYKDKFLEKALLSLVNQTNQHFNVYIGNDNSPYDLESICLKFKNLLNITYFKFDNNIGGKNIIDQWDRCIALSKNENWIWLFSDDDIADRTCVQDFYSIIANDNSKFDVYRFNTRVIGDDDIVKGETPESPFEEDALHMAYNILLGKRGNSMPDHIFSRIIYQKYGFVRTNWAQGADWATSILYSSEKGICTIPISKMNWRLGSYNISGTVSNNKRKEKIKGHLQCLSWIITFFEPIQLMDNIDISYSELLRATDHNLQEVVKNHYKGMSLSSIYDVFIFYSKKKSLLKSIYKTLRLYYIVNSH